LARDPALPAPRYGGVYDTPGLGQNEHRRSEHPVTTTLWETLWIALLYPVPGTDSRSREGEQAVCPVGGRPQWL